MGLLRKAWDGISSYFGNMSLLKKLTLAYAIAILIPTISIGSYTYIQLQNYLRKEIAQTARQNLLQIKTDIDRKVAITRSIANGIAFNQDVQNLLYYGMEFTPEALEHFFDSVSTPIDYALNFSEANIFQIGVYFVNASVPENTHFFREERLKNEDWYQTFKESKKDEIWIYPAASERFKNNGVNVETRVLKMVRKIIALDGSYLGVIMLDILEEDMFSSLHVEVQGREIYVTDNKNQITYPAGQRDSYIPLAVSQQIASGYSYHKKGNVLYIYENIEPLNIRLINKIPVQELQRYSSLSSTYMIVVVIIGVLLLEVFTYFLLKLIFSRLHQIVKIMKVVAKGNFDIRIPVKRKDEVGQLANDFNILIEKINELIADVIKKETAQKDAQLAALQYQINPHFIYNTIDTFRMRLELEGNYEMAEAITYFGKMMRYNINRNSQYATMREEVDYIGKYITLQKLRYGNRLELQVDLPPALADAKIIRFMLQPIVENSLKHGIDETDRTLCIHISFAQAEDYIVIHITDNGNGINRRHLERLNKRFKYPEEMDIKDAGDKNIGLMNINKRLKLFYGEEYYIQMESIVGEYTRTIIQIPYITD